MESFWLADCIAVVIGLKKTRNRLRCLVTDKQVAQSKMERLVREAQQERYGIIPPRSLSAALMTPLATT